MSDWILVTDKLPEHDSRVLMVGTKPSYNFGCPQILAGWFIARYYETMINEFRPVDSTGWTITHWQPAPKLP